jgi:hypothetical protein
MGRGCAISILRNAGLLHTSHCQTPSSLLAVLERVRATQVKDEAEREEQRTWHLFLRTSVCVCVCVCVCFTRQRELVLSKDQRAVACRDAAK